MVLLTISISRGSSERVTTSSSSKYQTSIYSSHSRSYPYSKGTDPRNSSIEHLLRPVKRIVRIENKYSHIPRVYRRRMANSGVEPGEAEMRKSYGIGGAGNIRRPSEVVYPPRLNSDGTPRRASVWSNMSSSPPPEGRRASIMSLFRKGSTGASGEDGAQFNATESGESRKQKSEVE